MPCDPVQLDPGHDDPGAGRCLMEHVSMLAGEAFRAWPRCTHPAVATLATQVEDRLLGGGAGTPCCAGPRPSSSPTATTRR